MDIKECRAYVNQCRKDYPPNSIIVELDNYPLIKCVVIHDDSKSWGYFREEHEHIALDRSNKPAVDFIVSSSKYSFRKIKNIYIISSNEEVKRVYTELFNSLCSGWSYSVCYLNEFFKWNPRLYTNLWDLSSRECTPKIGLWEITHCIADYTKPDIHKAFNLPVKYALIYLENVYISKRKLRLCADNNISPELVKYSASDLCRLEEKYISSKLIPYFKTRNGFCTYVDYLNMKDNLTEDMAKDFPTYPSIERLGDLHDKIVEVYHQELKKKDALKNQENNTRYKENYYSKACMYEYSNSEYSIIACKEMEDLVYEGNVLHHCVGTYINSVSHGHEYILFLRKNKSINTPYFTIDIDPNNNVRQIHGKYNCNIDDEIKPFIDEWAKKFNLNISSCNGVRCALN